MAAGSDSAPEGKGIGKMGVCALRLQSGLGVDWFRSTACKGFCTVDVLKRDHAKNL
jgi:hypothetical protein